MYKSIKRTRFKKDLVNSAISIFLMEKYPISSIKMMSRSNVIVYGEYFIHVKFGAELNTGEVDEYEDFIQIDEFDKWYEAFSISIGREVKIDNIIG